MQIIYGQIQYCANSLASILYILLGMWEMCAVFFFLNIHRNAVYKAKIILMSLKVNIWHHYL